MGFGSPSALARAAGRDFCGQKALEASLGKISATGISTKSSAFLPADLPELSLVLFVNGNQY